MLESDFMKRCLKRASLMGARLFRVNVGVAWVGEVTKNRDGSITIRNPRPFKSGVPGMSDLIGWAPVVVTPDMVGKTVAVYLAVETKSARGRASEEQKNFVSAVHKAGGRAGIARTDADLEVILCGGVFAAQGVDKNATLSHSSKR
jgi:hypothetical protein